MKKEDLVISVIATAITIGWIFTTFSVQQRLVQQRLSNNVHYQLVK